MKNLQLFTFNELSENAKSKALNEFNYSDYSFDYIYSDANNTLKVFKDTFEKKDSNENITGFRLAKWIINNYYDILFKPYFVRSVKKDAAIYHKRIKTTQYKNGNISNFYYSAIKKTNSCVLTGVCYDDDILKPIYEFLKSPYNINFDELISDCLDSLEKSIQSEIDYNYTDEAKAEYLNENDYYFTVDGKMINL